MSHNRVGTHHHLLGPTLERRLFTEIIEDEKGNEMLLSGIGPFLESFYLHDEDLNPANSSTYLCKIFTESDRSRNENDTFLDSTVRGVTEFVNSGLLFAWNFDQFCVLRKEELTTGNGIICAGRTCLFREPKEIIELHCDGQDELLVVTSTGVELISIKTTKKNQLTYVCSPVSGFTPSLKGHVIVCAAINMRNIPGQNDLYKLIDIILGLSDGRIFSVSNGKTKFVTAPSSTNSPLLDVCHTRRHVVVLFEKHITVYNPSRVVVAGGNSYDVVHTMVNPGFYKIVSDEYSVIYGLKKGSRKLYVLRDFENIDNICASFDQWTAKDDDYFISQVDTMKKKLKKIDFQVLAPVEPSFREISSVNCIRIGGGRRSTVVIGGSAGGWCLVDCAKDHYSHPALPFELCNDDELSNSEESSQAGGVHGEHGFTFVVNGVDVLVETKYGILSTGDEKYSLHPVLTGVTRLYTPPSNNPYVVFFAVGKKCNYLIDYDVPTPVVQVVPSESHHFDWVGFAGKDVIFLHEKQLSIYKYGLTKQRAHFDDMDVDIRKPIISGFVGDQKQKNKLIVIANGASFFVIRCRKKRYKQHPIFSEDQRKIFEKKKEMTVVDMIANENGFVILLNNGGLLSYRSDFSVNDNEDDFPIFTLCGMRFVDSLANATSLIAHGGENYAFRVKNHKENEAEVTLYALNSSKFILSENVPFNISEEPHKMAVQFNGNSQINLLLFDHNYTAVEFGGQKTVHMSESLCYNGGIIGLSVCSMSDCFTNGTLSLWQKTFMVITSGDTIQIGSHSPDTQKLTIHGRYELPGSKFSSPVIRTAEYTNDCTFCGTISVLNDKFGLYSVGFVIREDEKVEVCFKELPEHSIPLEDITDCSICKYGAEDGEIALMINKENVVTRSMSWGRERKLRPHLFDTVDNMSMVDFIALDQSQMIMIAVHFEKERIVGNRSLIKVINQEEVERHSYESTATSSVKTPLIGSTPQLSRVNGYTFFGAVADAEGDVYLVTGEEDASLHHRTIKDSPSMCWTTHKLSFSPITTQQTLKIHLSKGHNEQMKGAARTQMTIYRYVSGENCVRYIELDWLLKSNGKKGMMTTISQEKRIFVGHSTRREGGIHYEPMANGIVVYEDGVRVHYKCDCEEPRRTAS